MEGPHELYSPSFRPLFELEAIPQATRLPWFWATRLKSLPRSDQTVLVLPGFMMDDWATALLRSTLGRLGYRTMPWRQGINRGQRKQYVRALTACLDEIPSPKVAIIGWSLGGSYARDLARIRPQRVSQVITLGTPLVGGPRTTAAAAWYAKKAYDLDALANLQAQQARQPIPCPVTAIYSENDRFVCPAACIDPYHAHVQHVRVKCSHFGLVACPEVHTIVAETLASSA